MGDKEDYLASYRDFFENFAATVKPNEQLPVYIPVYLISEAELPGDVFHWTYDYLDRYNCPASLYLPIQRLVLEEVQAIVKKNPNCYKCTDKEVYSPMFLMQTVIAQVNDVCLRYLDNSKLDTLPPPQKVHRTVSAAMRNSRRVMEDRHTIIGNMEALFGIETTEPTSFYAVYDGHAGPSAAHYCTAHLHRFLIESPHFTSNLKEALRDSFIRTDLEFTRKCKYEGQMSGGSTAVVVCLRGRRLYVAWVGDSLALLAQRMRVMQLVCSHKPNREDERERVESMGGAVLYYGTWRVDGQLAVSRAIGDIQYKPYVTAKPEWGEYTLDGEEDFVVLACDGLWDFVSEDDVAVAVYQQIATDPDDLKAVAKCLTVKAKTQGSEDNITIIVVFLKDPRHIAVQNCPPMELGLDNAVVNAPPFVVDGEACNNVAEAAGGHVPQVADNGVSDSDSEDLGPETAVDIDEDNDVEMRVHEPAPPTPPAHTVEDNHVDGNLVDNVGESGEESEDEWNYFKGEGDRDRNPSEEVDEQLRSETPCQDTSAWETSSVDMNSSPLNPDAPVFVPGGVGSDVLLAESPRKPLPMDDIDVPDDANQFETEAVVRPAELQDLDNCDQLNGHHNISMEGVIEHLNGNDKCQMDSLGFGFNVGIESDKIKDTSLLQDFERIQKDTTDFCNIQVFQTSTETNPFGIDGNDELLERLKNKERDPMSMSFYQEKDDDTCERFSKLDSHVDLNAVQTLPDDVDDDDLQENGVCDNVIEDDKENISPDQPTDLFTGVNEYQEPNNDIIRIDGIADVVSFNLVSVENNFDNISDSNNMQNYSNIEFELNNQNENIVPTDTPESHKLLFEQIPEIPDGKSSELGFSNEDLDPLESEKDGRVITPHQDVDEASLQQPSDDAIQEKADENKNEIESTFIEHSDSVLENEIITESDIPKSSNEISSSPDPIESNEVLTENIENKTVVDVHQTQINPFENELQDNNQNDDRDTPKSPLDTDETLGYGLQKSPEPNISETQSPIPNELNEFASHTESPCASPSTGAMENLDLAKSPEPDFDDLQKLKQSPLPEISNADYTAFISQEQIEAPVSEVPSNQSPLPQQSNTENSSVSCQEQIELSLSEVPSKQSPLPGFDDDFSSFISQEKTELIPSEVPLPRESPTPSESPQPEDIPDQSEFSVLATESPTPVDEFIQKETISPVEVLKPQSPSPSVSPLPTEAQIENNLESEELQLEESQPHLPDVQKESQLLLQSEHLVDDCETSHVEESHNGPTDHIEKDVENLRLSPLPSEELRHDSPLPVVEQIYSPVPESYQFNIEKEEPELAVAAAASPVPEISLEPEQASEVLACDDLVPTESRIFDIPQESSETREELAPAPDVLPEQARSELVTDIDIGITESRAQEICVPVTAEIQQAEEKLATPPPTQTVQNDAPIAAPVAAAVLAGVAATAVAAKPKLTAKKPSSTSSPRSPKPAPKTETRTPVSGAAPKRPSTALRSPATTAAKTPAKTPVSATKPAPKPIARPSPKPASPTKLASKPLVKEPLVSKTAPAKPLSAPRPIAKAAPRPVGTAKPATGPASAPPAARPKPATTTSKLTATTTTTTTRTVKAPAPTPAAPKLRPATTKPAALAKPKEVKAKVPEKPLANGDVKPARTTKPAAPGTKPAPRPITRPTSAAAPPKPAAPKPAAARAPLDKQSKDLANKRLTAKTAPSRTAPAKPSAGNKTAIKCVPKKSDLKKEVITNGVNGTGDSDVTKPPLSPPPADNALLPDVIA